MHTQDSTNYTRAFFERLKKQVRKIQPDIASSHVDQVLAAGFGLKSHAALLAHFKRETTLQACWVESQALARLSSLNYQIPGECGLTIALFNTYGSFSDIKPMVEICISLLLKRTHTPFFEDDTRHSLHLYLESITQDHTDDSWNALKQLALLETKPYGTALYDKHIKSTHKASDARTKLLSAYKDSGRLEMMLKFVALTLIPITPKRVFAGKESDTKGQMTAVLSEVNRAGYEGVTEAEVQTILANTNTRIFLK